MSWWTSVATKVRRFVRAHPAQLLMLVAFLAIMGSQVGLVAHTYLAQEASRERIEELPRITLQDMDKMAQSGQIKEIVSHDIRWGSFLYPEHRSFLEIVDTKGASTAWERSSGDVLGEEVGKRLTQNSIDHPIAFRTGSVIVPNALSGLLTTAVLFIAIVILLVFGQKMITEVIGGHSFRAQRPDHSLTLDDVVGYDEVKQELRELKDQLLNAHVYAQRGIQAPRGILFTGDPGVGKTMMAKAFSNEIQADFFVCTGADFAEMYVGVGPRRVRSLFRLARLSAVAVIFIDEIDALGSRDQMGQDSERLATINAMLAELDGVNGNGRLVVIGATNNPNRLDPALRRPGRFDKTINIPLPDQETRIGILRRYLGNIPTDPALDVTALALRTPGYSGAQLKNIVAEAKQLAAREAGGAKEEWVITQDLLHRAQETIIMGVSETKSTGEDLLRVAVHELGHALAGYMLCQDQHIEKITVLGRGGALGYAISHPIDDRKLLSRTQMFNRLVMLLAGRAAERVMLGDVSAGAADDLAKASTQARRMVSDFGMGYDFAYAEPAEHAKFGRGVPPGVLLVPDASAVSQSSTDSRERMAEAVIDRAYQEAMTLVTAHADWVKDRTAQLMRQGVLMSNELFHDLPRPIPEGLPEWTKPILSHTGLAASVVDGAIAPTPPRKM